MTESYATTSSISEKTASTRHIEKLVAVEANYDARLAELDNGSNFMQ